MALNVTGLPKYGGYGSSLLNKKKTNLFSRGGLPASLQQPAEAYSTQPVSSASTGLQFNPVSSMGYSSFGGSYGSQPSYSQGGSYLKNVLAANQGAQSTTEYRAQQDRLAALNALLGGETQGIEALMGGQERAIGAYAGADELFRQMLQNPEVISQSLADKLYEKQRSTIEAGTQAAKRSLLESSGYRPSGYTQGRLGELSEAGLGQMASSQRDIELQRATTNRDALMSLLTQGLGLGQAKANIYGTTGQNIANIYGTTAANRANVYGNTIAATPQYTKRRSGLGGTYTYWR